ncbi:MAG: MBL fold metallo-hydrolase [Candidatus Omnitrophica bacterium]|nr:MBL fold metallo-hydrolase [Candidatus Omnitrophota bacterium]
MKKAILLFAFMLSLSVFAQAEQDFSNVEIKTQAVAGSVYMLEGSGGNIGVSVGEDGILIIDDQFAPLADKIHAALKDLSKGDLKFILNTHWHGDHTGGNEEFGREGVIIAHENVRKRLSSHQEVKLFNMVSEPQPEGALPVITFDDDLSIHFNGEEIKMIHLPSGHTDGDSIIYFTKSNVVHMGDHLFNGFYPFIDLDSGGSVQGVIKNLEKVLSMVPDDAKVIPGHGPVGTVDDIRASHDMIKKCAVLMQQAIDEGKSLEQIKKEGLPEDITEKWGKGFLTTDQWIEILYNSYTK